MAPGLNQLNFESTGLAHETERKLTAIGWFHEQLLKKLLIHSFRVLAKIRSPKQIINNRTLVAWLQEITNLTLPGVNARGFLVQPVDLLVDVATNK